MNARESLTDWARLDAMTDEDIDFSECPELTPEMFDRAVVRRGPKPMPDKVHVSLQLDTEVLAWFVREGDDYQARINALLRSHIEAQRPKAVSKSKQKTGKDKFVRVGGKQ